MRTSRSSLNKAARHAARASRLTRLALCGLLAISAASIASEQVPRSLEREELPSPSRPTAVSHEAADAVTHERDLEEVKTTDQDDSRSARENAGETAMPRAGERMEQEQEIRHRAPPDRGSLMGQGPSSLPLPGYRTPADPTPSRAAVDQEYEPEELLLVSSSMSEAIQAARDLGALRFRIKHRQALEHLDMVLSVFRLPADSDARRQLQIATQRLPRLQLELNHRYGLLASRQQMAQGMIQFSHAETGCLSDAHVGLLDTAVNLQHPALIDRDIELLQLAPSPPASRSHGTAIASLWVGNHEMGFLPMMPRARVSVAAVFRQGDARPDTTTDILLAGLDWLLGQGVEAINLGLGGPYNRLLDLALDRLLARDVLLVASAGNQGPGASPTYPAAQPGVFAATAVDASRQLYRQANRGPYIDFAAPGVQVWAASETGTAYHTGTSFAAPFVLAVLLAEKRLGQDWGQNARESALDLGPKGKDDSYGWGLVRWPTACG
ncbi:MAG: S8 family serine peptidase [Pseudomonadota bacterium]